MPGLLRGRKLLVVVVAVLLAAALLTSYIVLKPKPEPVIIGVIVPLTGVFSHMSEVRDTLQMAVDELNEHGGLNNRRIELVVADSESNASVAASEFERIESECHPLVYISVTSATTAAILPLAEEVGVPVIGVAVASTDLSGCEWFFRYYTTTAYEVDTAAEIVDMLGVTSLGVIYTTDAYGDNYAHAIEEHYNGTSVSVEFAPTQYDHEDFSDEIATLSDNEALFMVGPRTNLVTMLCQVNSSGYAGHVIAASGATAPSVTSLPEVEGTYMVSPLFYNPANIMADEFLERFHENFAYSPTHIAACGYDSMNLLWGLMIDHELTRDTVRTVMEEGFVFTGVMGNLKVQEGCHDIPFPLFPAVVSGGELWYL